MTSLIEIISQLYMQVSARLMQMRIDRPKWATGSTAGADIADPLIDRIRKYAAESARQTGAGATQAPRDPTVPAEDIERIAAAIASAKATPFPGPTQSNELALEFAKQPRAGTLPPSVGDQIKKRTFEYINHALELAKQGQVERAETAAKLAETALKAAAAYLSKEDYLAFEQEAMSRIAPPVEPDR